MKKTAFISIFIVILFAVSCSNEGKNDDTQSKNATSVTTTEIDTVESIVPPNIEAVDYNGYEFNILCPENTLWPIYDVTASEITGVALNDAVYNRNRVIEDKYNVNVHSISDSGASKARSSIMAGDDDYDLILLTQSDSFNLAISNLLADINSLPHLDFAKPWWQSYYLSDTSIDNKNYFCISDMNISAYDGTPVVLFNKEIAKNYTVDNLYDIVGRGEWTLDKFYDLCKRITMDFDGNNVMDEFDQYGATANNFSFDCFLYGTNTYFIKKDKNDIPTLDLSDERTISVIEKITTLVSDKSAFLLAEKPFVTDRELSPQNAFSEDRVLFWVSLLQAVSKLRQMETDFGILPMPKYDLAQTDYKSFVHIYTGMVTSIPTTNSDTDRTGRILEDLSYHSYLDVKPAYYETTLTGKYFRDEESRDMLDIIFGSYSCDLANVMRGAGLSLGNDLRGLINSESNTISSLIASNEGKYKGAVDKVIEALSK